MQTSHAPFINEGDIWPARVGRERWPFSFAWRDIKNAGATLVCGSDWTVAPFDPLINIYVGLNRKPWADGDPEQRLTLEECLIGYTRDAAYAEFQENHKGQLKPGYLADLVLFSEDLFQVAPEDILSAKVALTMVDGKVVYEAS
jgi:predicted amidohydrolase YtcJ